MFSSHSHTSSNPASSGFPFFDPPPSNSSSTTGDAHSTMVLGVVALSVVIVLCVLACVCPRPPEDDVQTPGYQWGGSQRPESVRLPERLQLPERVQQRLDVIPRPRTSSGESVMAPPQDRAEGDREEESGQHQQHRSPHSSSGRGTGHMFFLRVSWAAVLKGSESNDPPPYLRQFAILVACGPEEEDVEARAVRISARRVSNPGKCPTRGDGQMSREGPAPAPGDQFGESVPPPPGYTPMAMAKALLYYSKEDLTAGCGNRAEGDEEEEPGAALAAPLLNGRM
ncbi:hypothetical protein BU15DRAFT_81518 [Melanogaster broomeanus]|nr:hypothetical protein BU15DRAFT_81518 [Melanogaster broomeanus]